MIDYPKQKEAIEFDGGNILVSASAGSGKTFTMIERVKRLILEKGVDVNSILAVTFTEAAASDMKAKLKKALSDKIGGKDDARIVKQLAEIPTADISTLHSFCGRLIRRYFFAVGLSPDFSIIDESDATVMRLECVNRTFKEFYDSEEEWFYTLVDRHAGGRTDQKFKELILTAYAFCVSEADPDAFMDKYKYFYSEDGFNALLSDYKAAFDEQVAVYISDAEDALKVFAAHGLEKAVKFTESLIADMKFMAGQKDVYGVKKFENYSLRLDVERKLDPMVVDYKNAVSDVRDNLKKLLSKFGKNLNDRDTDFLRFKGYYIHTEGFIKVLRRFNEIYSAEKREENVLDFNDLEHFALKVLSDETICQAVKVKYKHVFVDEYQDINGVQEQIITSVSDDNLFMVGDVKQSIYGFRGCRPDFFDQKQKRMAIEGQKVIDLDMNFRSADQILKTVNTVFRFCMTEKYFGRAYGDCFTGGGYPDDKKGRVKLHFLEKESAEKKQEEEPRIYDVLQEIKKEETDDTANVASLVAEIINDELCKTYYDTKEKKDKQITYKDIAILTRSKNSVFVVKLVKGLTRHGIPVSSDVRENVCDFPEISMMVQALRLTDTFLDDVALASTLKSPIGNFTDEDLVNIATFIRAHDKDFHGTFAEAYKYYSDNAQGALADKVHLFNDYYGKLRTLSDFVGAEGVLNKLVKDFDLESYLYAEKNGRVKVARLLRFIKAASTNGKRLTVKEFLFKAENSPEAFGFAECGEENTVKAMTIHASKGLEFPVVIVCGLERAMNAEEEYEEILLSRKYGFAVKYYDDELRIKDETLLRGVIREDMKRERMKEEMRLFYVALTRATYSLHLTFEGKEEVRKGVFTGAEHFIDYIPDVLNFEMHDKSEFDFTNIKQGVRTVLIGQADQDKLDEMKKSFAYKYPFAEDTVLPLKKSVTSAMQSVEEIALEHIFTEDDCTDIERGNIAHKILEFYDFSARNSISVSAKYLIDGGILTAEEVDKINLQRLEKAINSGTFDALNGYALFREKPFLVSAPANMVMDTTSNESIVLQGVIDLLAVKDGVAKIFDYKYSSLTAESLKEKYKKQLDLYSYAVEKVLKVKVESKALVNLFTGETIQLV